MKEEFLFVKDKNYWVGLFYAIFSCGVILAAIKILTKFDSIIFDYIFSIIYIILTFDMFYNLSLTIFKLEKPRRKFLSTFRK
jgi:hypothetical protein